MIKDKLDISISQFPANIPVKKRLLLIGIEAYRLLCTELKRKPVRTYKGIKIKVI